MREKLRRAWEWFTLAKVPTVRSPVPECDNCERRATVFITVNLDGVRRDSQFCFRHRPPDLRV